MVTNTDIQDLGHFINGQTVLGKSGQFSDVYNPSTGTVIARVPLATKQEVQEAIVSPSGFFLLGVPYQLVNELKLSLDSANS